MAAKEAARAAARIEQPRQPEREHGERPVRAVRGRRGERRAPEIAVEERRGICDGWVALDGAVVVEDEAVGEGVEVEQTGGRGGQEAVRERNFCAAGWHFAVARSRARARAA